jgi:23S rRNA pseudouridine2605 synthase
MSYGPFQLGTLAAGQVEEIGPRVIREQLAGLIAPQNMPTGDRVMAAPEAVHRPSSGKRRAPLADGTSGDAMEPTKLVRKAGWAKPKVKAVYRGPAKPKAKTKTTISAKPAAPGAKAGKPAPRRPPKGR